LVVAYKTFDGEPVLLVVLDMKIIGVLFRQRKVVLKELVFGTVSIVVAGTRLDDIPIRSDMCW
jgi:hypothetical protein